MRTQRTGSTVDAASTVALCRTTLSRRCRGAASRRGQGGSGGHTRQSRGLQRGTSTASEALQRSEAAAMTGLSIGTVAQRSPHTIDAALR